MKPEHCQPIYEHETKAKQTKLQPTVDLVPRIWWHERLLTPPQICGFILNIVPCITANN
jgi:hypothetical protein